MKSKLFFAAMRSFLADGTQRALSEVYVHTLNTIIIPRVKKEMGDDEDAKELIEDYKNAAKRGSPQSEKYGRDCLSLIQRFTRDRKFGEDVAEDLAQEAINDILQTPNTIDAFRKTFNIVDGVEGFSGLMWRVTFRRLQNSFRTMQRHQKDTFHTDTGYTDDEGKHVNPLDNMASPELKTEEQEEEDAEDDEQTLGNLKDRMISYLRGKFPSGQTNEVLEQWIKVLNESNGDKIDFYPDVATPIVKKHGLQQSAQVGLFYHWDKKIRPEIVKFLKGVGVHVPAAIINRYGTKTSSMERRLIASEYARRFNSWMLS